MEDPNTDSNSNTITLDLSTPLDTLYTVFQTADRLLSVAPDADRVGEAIVDLFTAEFNSDEVSQALAYLRPIYDRMAGATQVMENMGVSEVLVNMPGHNEIAVTIDGVDTRQSMLDTLKIAHDALQASHEQNKVWEKSFNDLCNDYAKLAAGKNTATEPKEMTAEEFWKKFVGTVLTTETPKSV